MNGYGATGAVFLAAFFIFLLIAGWRFAKTVRPEAEEYLLMGRRLSLPAFVASLVSTWYGGILGVGEYSFKYGLSNWIVFGAPYYLAAFLFAIFLAKRAQASRALTIPDQFEIAYGKRTALLGAVFVFINAVPAAYILQVGVLANSIFGMPLVPAVIVGAIFSVVYVYTGGLKGDVFTDIIQFFLMFLGFIIIVATLIFRFGFLDFLSSHVPPANLTWNGGRPVSYILVWYFIALATLVEPSFYQRCFASRSGAEAKKGILISISFWAFFDFLTTFSGLYARALMPDLKDPMAAYPELGARFLPPFLQGIFLLGLFATVMSTVNSYALIAGTTIGKDIIGRLKKGAALESLKMTSYSRMGLVLASILAIAIALYFRSVIDIWYNFGTLTTVALLAPLANSFSSKSRLSPRLAVISMLFSTLIVLVWIIPNLIGGRPYFWGIEPIYPGLLVSGLVYAYGALKARNRTAPV
jgi:SSS family solute:Na+ symporter